MTTLTDLAAVLHLPEPLPSVVMGLTFDVAYTRAAKVKGMAKDRAVELADTLAHLEMLLRAGFLSRPFGADPAASISVTVPSSSHLRVTYQGTGAHVNLIHPIVRMIHAIHSTPDEGFAMLVAALGDADAARAIYDGVVFTDCVAGLTISDVLPHPAAGLIARLGPVAVMEGVPFPASGPLATDSTINADMLRLNAVVSDRADHDWLSLSGLMAFVPPDTKAECALGEEEIFALGDHTVIRRITVEQVFLFEYLQMLTAGHLPQLTLTA
jgi:hypothetical protein